MNLNRLLDGGGENYPGAEMCKTATQIVGSPSLLANLKQQRDATATKLAKIDDAIAALEANPAVADLIQKLGAI